MDVGDDGGLGVGHSGPPFEDLMILIGDGADDGPDVERLLTVGIHLLGEDLSDGGEVAACEDVWVVGDVAVDRVAGDEATRCLLAGHHVGVVVMCHQHVACGAQIRGPVLSLAVGAHHPVVAADAEVVFRGHTAGEVQRLLAGQHHGRLRGHHEDALRVHQHGCLGVPVRLGADVDARDDDVDLAAVLRELDDPLQCASHPVHVLGTRVHRDSRAG